MIKLAVVALLIVVAAAATSESSEEAGDVGVEDGIMYSKCIPLLPISVRKRAPKLVGAGRYQGLGMMRPGKRGKPALMHDDDDFVKRALFVKYPRGRLRG